MQGSITASCGHVLKDNEDIVPVRYRGEDCDPVDGFHPCTFYASFCPTCAARWKSEGLLLSDNDPDFEP